MFLGGTANVCTKPDKEYGNWAAEPVLNLFIRTLKSINGECRSFIDTY
jgi:hypothetical protein